MGVQTPEDPAAAERKELGSGGGSDRGWPPEGMVDLLIRFDDVVVDVAVLICRSIRPVDLHGEDGESAVNAA
jgi:hypothetical protein